jgi:hypothetical protein
LHKLGKCSTTELHPQSCAYIFNFYIIEVVHLDINDFPHFDKQELCPARKWFSSPYPNTLYFSSALVSNPSVPKNTVSSVILTLSFPSASSWQPLAKHVPTPPQPAHFHCCHLW